MATAKGSRSCPAFSSGSNSRPSPGSGVCVWGGREGGGAGRREIGKKRRSTSYFLFRGELPSVAEAESSQSL